MFPDIQNKISKLINQFDTIPESRKLLLQKITAYMQAKVNEKAPVQLVYICTHNSRRSHFGQIAAALAALYYHVPGVKTFSGGTEATAFNSNAIKAVEKFGLSINKLSQENNAKHEVVLGEGQQIICFSKKYDNVTNPSQDFAAIMVCSEAEENCPFVAGASARIATPYNDPKDFDGTTAQDQAYSARFEQILIETLFAYSLLKQ